MWWIKLGILPERIEPGHPEQNGRHERMHRTLKAEATKPSSDSFTAQQRRFDLFRREYNDVRPHEALGQVPPAKLYEPSPRTYPSELAPPEYKQGVVRWACKGFKLLPRHPAAHIAVPVGRHQCRVSGNALDQSYSASSNVTRQS